MIEYWDIDKFICKKADLYNYINPFFDLKYLKSHNFFYLNMALGFYKNYFDNLYINVDSNICLDINQRIAILTNSKNELIIAGAGSGKTTTIAAKIKFMVDILKINENSILLLSYTNEAVLEMKKIIVFNFKINVNILTFHKFAILLLNSIKNIKEYLNHKEVLKNYNVKEKAILFLFLITFYDLKPINIKKKDSEFINAFNNFQKDFNKYYYETLKLKKSIGSYFFRKVSETYFKKSYRNSITFDSLIYEAYKKENYNYHFKYILIDEYQDISNLRFKFIKNYVSKENSKLMCVGDDWQTIFSFASSNINNILDFDKSFNDAKILKIVNTYRNSQELIDIAGDFVMKNACQIKKRLKSTKNLKNPIELIEYKNKNDAINKISEIIENIGNKKIAFLGRYKFDVDSFIDDKIFKLNGNKIIFKDTQEIYFYTIHSSKGLGFDYVFILNHKKGYYGFPPRRKIFSFFKEESAFYEERRLYYVALTRTKNKVYLVYPKKNNSCFLKEIKKMLKKK